MASFRSSHYPRSKNTFAITQEYAMRYYAILVFIVMLAAVIRFHKEKDMLIFAIIAAIGCIFLGNVLARVKLRRSIAEIFFVNDGFSIISVHDILHQSPKRSFPLRWANATRTQDVIQFHFEDQIMTIKREDWADEFDLIWTWFISGQHDLGPIAESSNYE